MPWIFSIPEMWMDIVLFLRTVTLPDWQQDSGNPECWCWVWARKRRPNLLFPHVISLNIWISFTAISRKKRKKEDLETAAEAKKAESSNNKQNSSGSKKNKDLKKVRKTINAIIEKFSDEEGWLSSGQLGDQLGKRLPDFDVRNYGYSKLTPFIKSLGSYETGRIPTGSGGRKQIYFRMKEER